VAPTDPDAPPAIAVAIRTAVSQPMTTRSGRDADVVRIQILLINAGYRSQP
jgi:hypothetical protein